MKRIVGLILVVFLSSCANSNKEAAYAEDEIVENEVSEYVMDRKNFTLENLVSERLQSYFELLKLKNEHPEFQEDIQKQLKEFSKEGLAKEDNSNFSLENIRKIGENEVLSDSVQSMKLYYDVVSGNLTETDSIEALITTKTILLDEIETKSTKISFLRIE